MNSLMRDRIDTVAAQYGLNPNIFAALVEKENNYDDMQNAAIFLSDMYKATGNYRDALAAYAVGLEPSQSGNFVEKQKGVKFAREVFEASGASNFEFGMSQVPGYINQDTLGNKKPGVFGTIGDYMQGGLVNVAVVAMGGALLFLAIWNTVKTAPVILEK